MKIELEKIETAMSENGVDEAIIAAVITQLKSEIEEELQPEIEDETPTNDDLTDGSEDLPKVKYEYIIVLNDKEGFLKDKEIAGWVVQQEENADAGLIVSKISDAVKDQNAGAKRKKHSMTNLTEAFESLKSKWLTPKKLKIKTKELTRVIISDGKLH
jgi:2-C-methyl-D-erythritol 4-phosphate cytidylyltransferase